MDILFTNNGERFVPVRDYNGYAIGDNGTVMSKRIGGKWKNYLLIMAAQVHIYVLL